MHEMTSAGQPLPVVLLPGMMCDARLFAPQMAILSLACSVMVSPLTGADSIEKLAERVLADAPQRFVLGGLSMGGIVAMEIARQAPERVAGLILMDTNPLPESAARSATREPQMIGARTGRLEEIIREEMKPNYLAPGPRRTEILDLVVDMAMALGAEVFVDQSRALQRRPDQQSTLRRLKCPALVLCGEHDTLCPLARHTLMDDLIPQSQLRVISGAGHLPVLEQPDAVTSAIATFLSDL